MNSDALTLCLAYEFARVECRNVNAAVIRAARKLRSETKDREVYALLGEVITMTSDEREKAIGLMRRMFIMGVTE